MFCGNCGHQLSDEAKFCSQCGHPTRVPSPISHNGSETNNFNNSLGNVEKQDSLRLGDEITFGSYSGREMRWKVLDIQNNRALIVSTHNVCDMLFHQPGGSTTWRDCTLRRWLNNEFINSCFTEMEKSRILPHECDDEFNIGDLVVDRVFVLNTFEAHNLFSNDQERAGDGEWWTRSPGASSEMAAIVDIHGQIYMSGYYVNNKACPYFDVGVRPALCLKCNS